MSGRDEAGGHSGPERSILEAVLGGILLGATVIAAGLLALAVAWPAGPAGRAGVVVLLAAPVGVILTAAVLYGRAGEWRLTATALLLLAILGVGLWLQVAIGAPG